jgi:hypothetical protein
MLRARSWELGARTENAQGTVHSAQGSWSFASLIIKLNIRGSHELGTSQLLCALRSEPCALTKKSPHTPGFFLYLFF